MVLAEFWWLLNDNGQAEDALEWFRASQNETNEYRDKTTLICQTDDSELNDPSERL
jgi:hypothetical protein